MDPERSASRRSEWPDVKTLDGAQRAIRIGYVGAYFAAAMTVAITRIVDWLITAKGWGFESRVAVGVFLAIGVGVQFRSRTAAVVGLLLIPSAALIPAATLGGWLGYWIALLLLLSLVNGVRGTFAYHKLKRAESTSSDDAAAVPVESDSLAEEAPAHYDHEWRSFYSARHGEVPLFKDRCETCGELRPWPLSRFVLLVGVIVGILIGLLAAGFYASAGSTGTAILNVLVLVAAVVALVVSVVSLMATLRIRMGRLTVGFVAALVAVISGLGLAFLEARLFGVIHWAIGWLAFGAGISVFLLADKLDLIAESHSPDLSLSAGDAQETPSETRGETER